MSQESLEGAATWRMRQAHGLTESESQELERWLQVDENASAYHQVARAWDAMGMADESEIQALRARARATVRRRTPVLALRIAAGFAALAVLGGVYGWQVGKVYANPDGPPRVVVLSDGSRVTMDTGARVRVRYSPLERHLALESGQASFEVAHNPNRPFRVHAGAMTVIARGTVFNVDRWSKGATVSLLQGKVDVTEGPGWPAAPRDQTKLTPGQSVRMENDRLSKPTAVDNGAAKAWLTGAIVFNDVSLAEAVERVNRYGGGPTVLLSEPGIGALRVSGVFRAGSPEAFSEGVSRLYNLKSHADAGKVVIEPAGAG